MSIHHHPSEAVLIAYASGALADGPGLATAIHLETCAQCRRAVSLLEAVGGALIEAEAPSAMGPQALDLALARIERPFTAEQVREPPATLAGKRLPPALAGRRIAPRRWLAPDLWVAHVPSNAPDGWRTYLLHAGKGMRLLEHGHRGPEMTVVLHGAFTDSTGRYAAGDFAQVERDLEHEPHVDGDGPCLCLISAQGGVRAKGLGRLLQPFLQV